MSRRALPILIALILLITLVNIAGLWYVNHQLHREVVIDVIHVFNEFKMKKELEARVAVKLDGFTNRGDSLKGIYEALQRSKATQPQLDNIAVQLSTLQQEAQQAYTKSNQTINEQVWQRLNTLIDDYGKAHNYRLMIGANGMGTVLYNEKEIDKTDDLIQYINSRYEKGS